MKTGSSAVMLFHNCSRQATHKGMLACTNTVADNVAQPQMHSKPHLLFYKTHALSSPQANPEKVQA